MVFVIRDRSLGPYYTGQQERLKLGNTDFPPPAFRYSKVMKDTVGNPHGNNILELDTIDVSGSLTGDNHLPGLQRRSVTNYTMNRRIPSHLVLPGASLGADAAKAVADSNPARSHVNVPVFLFELADIPKLVRLAGKDVFASIGSANLSWQFGIKPFLSDVSKMFNFAGAFEKRLKELDDLQTSGGLKRSVTLGTDEASSSETFVMESYMFFANSVGRVTTKRKRWATVYWKPVHSFSKLPGGRKAQEQYARQAMLGLTKAQTAQNIWEGLPWSWLVDWFSSAGDMIASQNNSIAHVLQPVVICHHTTTRRTDSITGIPEWCGGDTTWTGTKESKYRYLSSPQLAVNVPFLSKRQLSILASLAALKR